MVDSFIDALAKPKPVPGGGAAAAHGACVGLALLEKIVLVELQRGRDSSEAEWRNLLQEVKKSSATILQLRDEDGKAYVSFAQAKTLGKDKREVLEALQQAIECPIRIMEEAHEALSFVARAGKRCKGHLLSDLLVVCELLRATISGTYRIAQANLSLMEKSPMSNEYQGRLERLISDGMELYESVASALVQRAGLRN
ncbi:MAG: cyclodeaminase/cyclohydrolase family protein [Deltaproteobacteria bacterium]|nr:MAG: cyclodeaminase/cyclohydrolase family protein [Deltaproteobacteria bacterium]